MAFMEKPPAGKVLLDDTVPLTAAIEASQSLQSHTRLPYNRFPCSSDQNQSGRWWNL
ncbi:PXK isoform 3 [Pongo abelii]|uniref:PX domain containing serine/threonine kinase like n=5 Tax=Simiiformes TaxID=314293 RepID=A0A2K5RIJ4_CEBIM|nr:PXK isoform 3 [Pongo abelii]